MIDIKKRKEKIPVFNHDEKNINEALDIDIGNLVNSNYDEYLKPGELKNSEAVECFYKFDKIALAYLVVSITRQLELKKEK